MKPRVCADQGKHMYPTQMAAIRAAISYSKSRGVALRVYRHHACGSFHLTRAPRVDTNNRRSA